MSPGYLSKNIKSIEIVPIDNSCLDLSKCVKCFAIKKIPIDSINALNIWHEIHGSNYLKGSQFLPYYK